MIVNRRFPRLASRRLWRNHSAMQGIARFARSNGLLAAVIMLAACGGEKASTANQAVEGAPQAGANAAPQAKPHNVEIKTDLYEFTSTWPAEAEAIPALAQRLRAEEEKRKSELSGGAEEEKAYMEKEGMEYQQYSLSTVYETGGQSDRLLSLRVDVGGYEGGAHGHYAVGSLLWDRATNKEIKFADLFSDVANRDRLLTQRWCDALNKAREEKRGAPVGGDDMFEDCPSFDDIAIIPVDSNKDGRLDRLLMVASPYVAGPWVEGAYEIELAVTPETIAGLKAEYRPSFSS